VSLFIYLFIFLFFFGPDMCTVMALT